MRNFNTRFRLRDSDRWIRLVYTQFLLFMAAAFAFSFYWGHTMTSFWPKAVAEHYRGSDATFGEPMEFKDLAGITHFHLFTMPVVYVIMLHVLYLTEAGRRVKLWTTWASFYGMVLDIASPWLILYVSPYFALTMLLGDLLLAVTFVVLLVVPLHELWIKRRPFMAAGRPSDERAATPLLSAQQPDPARQP